jgi:hypothetical protein
MIKNITLVITNQCGTLISRFLINNVAAQKFTITLNIKDNNQPSMMIKPLIS